MIDYNSHFQQFLQIYLPILVWYIKNFTLILSVTKNHLCFYLLQNSLRSKIIFCLVFCALAVFQ